MKRERVGEIDYLKCVLIVLMVAFHLVHVGDSFPYAKQVVYTFHMPAFLLMSGYLMNIARTDSDGAWQAKPWPQFLRLIWWFFVPYVVMESGYTVMASLLPIREHIDHLSLQVFLSKLLLHPLGPYWYLHTLMLCGLTYYGVFRLPRLTVVSRFVLMGLMLALLSRLHVLSLPHALYFLAGAVVRRSGVSLLAVLRPSWLSAVAFALLAAVPDNLSCDAAGGILMVWLAMSTLLAVYPHVQGRLRTVMLFLGRNTLPLFLFSPLFTIVCRPLVEVFSFDPTCLLFLTVSLTICLGGSLAVAALLDACRLSPLLFGTPSCIKRS